MELPIDIHRQLAEGAQVPRRKLPISSQVVPGLLAGLDSAVILGVAGISYSLLVGYASIEPGYYAAATAFVWLCTILLMQFGGLYQFEPIMRPLAFADKILVSFATAFLFALAAAFSLKISSDFSRLWIGSFALGSCAGLVGVRILVSQLLRRLGDRQFFTRNVVVIGAGEQVQRLLAFIEANRPRFISVLGLFVDAPHHAEQHFSGYPILGGQGDLSAYVSLNQVDDVIIALPWSDDQKIVALMAKLRELPVNVYLGADLVGFRLPFRQPPDHFGNVPVVEVMGQPLAGWGGIRKAALDYVLGFVLTILLLPLMVIIAIAIRLDSRGPALFRQERLGFVNRSFSIYKFRTMRQETGTAEKTIQATRNDPRVTRLGRLLRRTSLDELPQLLNVLNGSMSLVGPRPHAVDHNEAYAQVIRGYFARHRVKPGMTGWAQVNGLRGEIKTIEDMEARVKYDVYYAENWSVLFDLKILVMTAVICLTGRNAY